MHPEHKLREHSWELLQRKKAIEALEKIRSYVPLMTSVTQQKLAQYIKPTLAHYICKRKALHLVRMDSHAISKLHSADLFQRYQIHGLGLTETQALWLACVDVDWRDPRKIDWWHQLQAQLRRLSENIKSLQKENTSSPFDDESLPLGPFDPSTTTNILQLVDSNNNLNQFEEQENDYAQQDIKTKPVKQSAFSKKIIRTRAASLPPTSTSSTLGKKDEWWSQKIRDDASHKALDRARDAAKRMRDAQKLSKPESFFLHDFLLEHGLEKWDLPLGQRFLLTTSDIAHMSDRNIQDIANSAGFNKIDVLRFKLALQHLQDSRVLNQRW
mmetsp:Transcript_8747/g.10675  ORF Transcript_8747/g.10675 Transcript_8747/m.10675 type:complete len:327 (+) Transcript_8747:579-1559(+)